MKPLDLREYAENLIRAGTSEESEFGKEILENLNFVEDAEYLDLIEDIEHYAKESEIAEPRKMVEWLGDRSNQIGDIENLFEAFAENFKMAGIDIADMDIDDIALALCERLPTEYDL